MSMSSQQDTLYLKIERNVMVTDRHVTLSDVAKMTSSNTAMVRQLKQMKIYSFPQKGKKQEYIQVISTMKIIEMILQEYPNVNITNEGEVDFVLEYKKRAVPPKGAELAKSIVLCILVFFGASFSIMAFNNDVGVLDVFAKFYAQVTGAPSNGVTELEICYSIGLPLGVILFFNHFGNSKITNDPTPLQVEMRKYETDVDNTYIENAGRGGKSIDVD